MITKPAAKLLKEHQHLLEEAKKNGVFVFIEHHKRFDPAYADARNRAVKGSLGEFNYFYSYMSQPIEPTGDVQSLGRQGQRYIVLP